MLGAGREGLFTPEYMEYLAKHHFRLRPGFKCLDVGTGLGYLLFSLMKHVLPGGTFVGVDVSRKLLASARYRAEKLGVKEHLTFRQASAEALPFGDGSFDRVMCQTLLQHLPQPEAGLAEMVRVCRPGGLVACIEPQNAFRSIYDNTGLEDDRSWERYSQYYFRCWEATRERDEGDYLIGRRLVQMFVDAGFTDIVARRAETVSLILPGEQSEQMQRRKDALKAELEQRLAALEGVGDTKPPEWLIAAVGKRDLRWFARFMRESTEKQLELLTEDKLILASEIPLVLVAGRKPHQPQFSGRPGQP